MGSEEFQLIDWIRRQIPAHARVRVGIGDDAAVLAPTVVEQLITVDMLMEGTDFLLDQASPEQIGRKAMSANLSDIAAMAGRPTVAVVSVALPRRGGEALARGLQAGLRERADQFGVALAGGDTNTWDGPLVISVTVLGEALAPGPVLRSGAKPGDWIFVTGALGGSILGHHLDFVPRVSEAQTLHQFCTLHAMLDLSDGLAGDLRHILEESHVGAIVDAAAIPVSTAAATMNDSRSLLEHALGDGEDFELLFTTSPADGERLLAQSPLAIPITKIGEITSAREYLLRHPDGKIEPLPDTGWKHGFDA